MIRRLVPFLSLAAAVAAVGLAALPDSQAADPESARVKTVREKASTVKLNLDIDKKMLRAVLEELPAVLKEAYKVTVKIEPLPGAGVNLNAKYEFKGEMTLEQVLNKIGEESGGGWYVNVAKPNDQKEGTIFLTTNPKERGYKEGTGPGGKEVAKKDEPKGKGKEKAKEEPKTGGDEREAAELLTKAKLQAQLKQPDKAKATANEIIEKYPDTKQAAEAKKLLEKLGK